MPFLLLPYRPGSDPVGSKSFIRNFFRKEYDNAWENKPKQLHDELMLMEPVVCRRLPYSASSITADTKL